MPSFKKIFTFI